MYVCRMLAGLMNHSIHFLGKLRGPTLMKRNYEVLILLIMMILFGPMCLQNADTSFWTVLLWSLVD